MAVHMPLIGGFRTGAAVFDAGFCCCERSAPVSLVAAAHVLGSAGSS
jgi:hypothetical protein